MPKLMIINCPNCKFEGSTKSTVKGSFAVELALWCCFVAPGIIYSVWRLANQVYICPKCHYEYVVKKGYADIPATPFNKIWGMTWKIALGIFFGLLGVGWIISKMEHKQDKVPIRNTSNVAGKQTELPGHDIGYTTQEIDELTSKISEKCRQAGFSEESLLAIKEKVILAYKIEMVHTGDTQQEKLAARKKINDLFKAQTRTANNIEGFNLFDMVPETSKVGDAGQKTNQTLSKSAYIIRKIITNNIGVLGRVIPEITNLDEILGRNRTQSQELSYLVAVIEERMDSIWKKNEYEHCYFIEPAIWQQIPFEEKEELLWVVYEEEKTPWELRDMYSGRILGKATILKKIIY